MLSHGYPPVVVKSRSGGMNARQIGSVDAAAALATHPRPHSIIQSFFRSFILDCYECSIPGAKLHAQEGRGVDVFLDCGYLATSSTALTQVARRNELMANPAAAPQPRVLIVDDELAKLDTALGRAVNHLAAALEARNVEVVQSNII